MSNQIKNIVFDLGGVLVGLDEGRCIQAFDQLGCQQVSHYVNQRLAQGLFHDLEIGNISTRQFCDEVRRMTESNVSDDDIMKTWNLMLVSMPDYKKEKLMELRGKYRLFLLSNTNDIHWLFCVNELFPYQGGTIADCFEQVFLSYQMHLAKPDVEIFKEVLRLAELNPDETLFVDDSPVNIESAEQAGMHGLLNRHLDDWISEL